MTAAEARAECAARGCRLLVAAGSVLMVCKSPNHWLIDEVLDVGGFRKAVDKGDHIILYLKGLGKNHRPDWRIPS